jgi:dGTPase
VPGYDRSATARWVAEQPKRAGRSDFERDRARVLHSAALRRLAAKTQVVTAGSADFPRTRLTHSLECAQIGRELGYELGCDPDLVDAACLAHDIGHSPFGHNGEFALDELAQPCGGFEGNAQSLRLLTRLEPKVAGAGLNLTRATLDATLKYPWFSQGPGTKYGVYAEDAEVFGWIRENAPAGRPCLEAQVMDWADDIAYSVHDLEDGFHAGLITFKNLNSSAERSVVSHVTATTYCSDEVSETELTEILDALLGLDIWPASYDGGPETVAALKNLTSELIGRFCLATQDATLAAHAPGTTNPSGLTNHSGLTNPTHPVLTRYAADLIVPRQQRLECALLKGITAHYVMARAGVVAAQARERQLLAELAYAIEEGAPQTLDPLLRPAWDVAATDPARRRVVIDQVACLTDTSAIAWHHRLCVLFNRSRYSDARVTAARTSDVSVRSGRTTCAPAAASSSAEKLPVATPTARAPAASAAATSNDVSPTNTVDVPPKSAPYAWNAARLATGTSSARTSCISPYAPTSRSRCSPIPARPSLSSASGRTFPVRTDWRAPASASAARAAEAPGMGRTSSGTSPSAAADCRARTARRSSTWTRGSAIPASASVSSRIARSVRPALEATVNRSRPNSSLNAASYMRVPRPPALTSV